ncbi:hypothetical protein SAMN02745866_01923 [Alteromonadaceae bacterium Bs31]|nr:hypothetical protein SAMN02745866_01923 [Alteromonadaceae bacterium Bs31]
MKIFRITPALLGLFLSSTGALAQEDRVELDTTIIKGNTELPKILYVVPWKDLDGMSGNQQKLILHSLFGDLFDPVSPLAPATSLTAEIQQQESPSDKGLEIQGKN